MTNNQIMTIVLKEQLDTDPEFKALMINYNKIVDEFGYVTPPVSLRNKLADIDLLVKARMNSNLLQ